MRTLPKSLLDLNILVGGMGVDISSVELVAAAAKHPSGRISGSLSATALPHIYTHRLQLGDAQGEIRKAFDAFNERVPALADDIDRLYAQYHIPGGKIVTEPFRGLSMGGLTPSRDVQILTLAATFAHVWRTKRAAPGRPVGMNFLRKIEHPLLYGLYGAMLGGADWIVMGAGDPSDIPGFLDRLARHEPVELFMQVATVPRGTYKVRFDPKELVGDAPPPPRPAFFAIISSHLQAAGLAASPETRPDGFVIEGPPAGGHNAPPLKKKLDERGYYRYGPEDDADLSAVADVGLPFWVAGGYGHPEKPRSAKGPRRGRQVGTLFALTKESGMDPGIRRRVLQMIWKQQLEVVTNAVASPSSYPFKLALVPGTIGDPAVYADRRRVCNVGYLRGYRPMGRRVVGLCPADDPAHFKKSGGALWRTKGAMCLCNGLLAACGAGQPGEKGVVTLGDITPVRGLQQRLKRLEYTTQEAIAYLLDQ